MRQKSHLYIALFFVALALQIASAQVFAQQSQAKASADTSRILIGDQVNIILEVNQVNSRSFEFPVFRDSIIDKIEILSVSPIDTLELEGRMKLRQHLLVTSFDTGFYVIPSFYFYDRKNNDSLKSNPFSIEVLTMEIDTTKGITDIKLPIDVPLGFWEIAPYLFVALFLLAIAIFFWLYYKKRKGEVKEQPIRIKPAEPAHLWALRELDKLSGEKLWQKDKIKLFHSRLTDIVRTYLEFRFEIKSMEFTTAETMAACKNRTEINEDLHHNLQSLLELADLVKFAKWNPLPDENEKSEKIAYDFVLKTKLAPVLRKPESDAANESESSPKRKEGGNAE